MRVQYTRTKGPCSRGRTYRLTTALRRVVQMQNVRLPCSLAIGPVAARMWKKERNETLRIQVILCRNYVVVCTPPLDFFAPDGSAGRPLIPSSAVHPQPPDRLSCTLACARGLSSSRGLGRSCGTKKPEVGDKPVAPTMDDFAMPVSITKSMANAASPSPTWAFRTFLPVHAHRPSGTSGL